MENTTLFTCKPGESTSTFSNASFIPIFLDEPINFASESLRVAAELACQGDMNCLFDIASTGDVSVGASTMPNKSLYRLKVNLRPYVSMMYCFITRQEHKINTIIKQKE